MPINDTIMPRPDWSWAKVGAYAYLHYVSSEPYLQFRRLVASLAGAGVDAPEAAAGVFRTLDTIGSRFLRFTNDDLAEVGCVIQITVDEAQALLELFSRKLDGLKREHGVNFGAADALLAACTALARAMMQIMYGCYSFGHDSLPVCTCHRSRRSRKIKRRIP